MVQVQENKGLRADGGIMQFWTELFKHLFMPQLHLLWSSYDLVVYDFPYDFFDIVGGNKLRRLRLHCL